MRKRLLVTAFALFASTGLAAAFDVAGWDVQPLRSDGGGFLGCTMAASYDDGTRAGLMVIPGEGWAITMSNRKWSIRKGYKTPARVLVDGNTVATGTATAIDANFLVLPLEGAEAYQALQAGRAMRIITQAGSVSLSLSGTRAAMDAVLTCVESYRSASSRPTGSPQKGAVVVPGSEVLVLASNLLAAAGLSGYRVDPPKDDVVSWTLANGVKGGLAAMQNFQGEPESAASDLIKQMAADCRGEFISAKKPTPTLDGTIVRKVVTACTESGRRSESYITMVQQSGGLLVILYHSGLNDGAESRTPAAEADEQIVRAVLAKR